MIATLTPATVLATPLPGGRIGGGDGLVGHRWCQRGRIRRSMRCWRRRGRRRGSWYPFVFRVLQRRSDVAIEAASSRARIWPGVARTWMRLAAVRSTCGAAATDACQRFGARGPASTTTRTLLFVIASPKRAGRIECCCRPRRPGRSGRWPQSLASAFGLFRHRPRVQPGDAWFRVTWMPGVAGGPLCGGLRWRRRPRAACSRKSAGGAIARTASIAATAIGSARLRITEATPSSSPRGSGPSRRRNGTALSGTSGRRRTALIVA